MNFPPCPYLKLFLRRSNSSQNETTTVAAVKSIEQIMLRILSKYLFREHVKEPHSVYKSDFLDACPVFQLLSPAACQIV